MEKSKNKELGPKTKKIIDSILIEISKIAELEKTQTLFAIANTKKANNGEMYFPPIRNTHHGVVGNVVVYTVEQAKKIANYLNGKVDIILVDAEKKILKSEYGGKDVGNIERVVFETVDKSKIYSFKANDLTVNAVDCYIAQVKKPLSGKIISILGAGNIGSKLALSIVERGVNVRIYRRNKNFSKKIADALNIIRTGELIAKVESSDTNVDACKDADVIIGCTPGIPVISKECIDVMKKDGIIIDVGKGSIHKEAISYALSNKINVIRTDIRAGFEGTISTIFNTIDLIENIIGKSEIDGITIVSGGFMGKEGDIIVNNYKKPRLIVGVADGKGDIKRKLSNEDREKIENIKNVFGLTF